MIPVQIFLEWEIKLNLDLLKRPISDFAKNIEAYNFARDARLHITINQFRRDLGVVIHPDDRGNKFIWEGDEERPGDNVIPPEVIIAAWQLISNGVSPGIAEAAYPELYAAYLEAQSE